MYMLASSQLVARAAGHTWNSSRCCFCWFIAFIGCYSIWRRKFL